MAVASQLGTTDYEHEGEKHWNIGRRRPACCLRIQRPLWHNEWGGKGVVHRHVLRGLAGRYIMIWEGRALWGNELAPFGEVFSGEHPRHGLVGSTRSRPDREGVTHILALANYIPSTVNMSSNGITNQWIF
ncbi:hypothetical protein B0H17DRAFT_1142066 [Mycena rosella]|uniref:Uncharacterized protein n=1 Tax=Mycena rosella TaxID=1033263 RepID=A0AAD7CY67_MYCRO|nr:hypothetical protein B0H17DRAFT_1142066 [Mycena rosella]